MKDHGNVKQLVKKLNWNSLNLSPLQKELVDLDQVFDKSADAIILISLEYNVLRVNPTFRSMTGIGSLEVRGMKCHNLLGSSICYTEECPIVRIMNGEEEFEFEAKKIASGSKKIPALLSIKPLRNPQGQVIGIIEFIRDLSKLKDSENALRESEHKFRTYIDQSPDGVVITNDKGRHVEVNDAFCRLMGYSRQELQELSILDRTPLDDWVKITEIGTKRSHMSEITHVKKRRGKGNS